MTLNPHNDNESSGGDKHLTDMRVMSFLASIVHSKRQNDGIRELAKELLIEMEHCNDCLSCGTKDGGVR